MIKVIHFLGSSVYGGGTQVVIDIATITREIGFETYVFTNDERTKKRLSELDFKVISSENGSSIFQTMKSLFLFLKRNKVEIIHTHTTIWGYVGRFIAKLSGTKMIIHHVHNLYYYMPNNIFYQKTAYLIEAIFGKYFSDIMIFVEREKFERFDIKTKAEILYIPNGVDNEKYIIKPNVSIDSKVNIGYLGRLEKSKGLHTLLALFCEDNFKNKFNLVIAGKGELNKIVEETAIKYKNIEYMGFINDIEDFFKKIDILILPTLYEGLSLSILESLAHGKPVITTNIAGNRYLVFNEKNGFLYDIDNEESLRNILKNLTKSQCIEMGEAAKAVAEDYDIKKFNYRINTLYKKLLKELMC